LAPKREIHGARRSDSIAHSRTPLDDYDHNGFSNLFGYATGVANLI